MADPNPFADLVVGADDFAREVKEGNLSATDAGTLQKPIDGVTGPDRFSDLRESARMFGADLRREEEADQQFQQQITAYSAAHQDADPDKRAEVLRYSAATGLAPEIVEGQLDTLRKKVDAQALSAALASRPEYAAMLADAAKAPIVKDDAASLGWLEWSLTGKWEVVPHTIFSSPNPLLPNIALPIPEMRVGPGWARAFQNAVGEQKVVALAAKQAAGISTPDEDARLAELEEQFGERDYGANNFLSKGVVGAAKMLPYIGGSVVARAAGTVAGTVGGAIAGAGAGAETGPGAAVTGAGGGLTGAGFGEWAGGAAFDFYQNVGPQYRAMKKMVDANGKPLLTDDEARTYAVAASALAAGITSGLGGKIVKSLPGVKPLLARIGGRSLQLALEKPTTTVALKALGVKYGTHLAAGGLMMATQAAANVGAEEIAKANHGQEGSFENVAVAAGEAFVRGLQDMSVIAAIGPGREFLQDVGVGGKTAADQRRMSVLFQAAKESKLLDRSPEEFAAFVDRVMKKGADDAGNVYIPVDDWMELHQAQKVDPGAEAARVMKDDGKAFSEAVATKGDLAIPMKDFLVAYAKGENAAALADIAKLSADGRSPKQQKLFQEQLKVKLEKLEKDRKGELDAGETAVHGFIRDQALGADVSQAEAEAVAKQVSQFARTMALRLNVSVEEAAAVAGISRLRILGPKGDLIAESARKKFLAEVSAPAASKHLADRLASMTDAELRAREIYIDRVSGLRNANVFDSEPIPEGKAVALLTSPSVKGINDHETAGGHDVANDLLRTMGVALGEGRPEAARGGTNFRFLVDAGKEQEQLAAAIAQVKAALPDQNIDLIGVHGKDLEGAFANLKTETDRRRGLKPEEADHIPERGKLRAGLDVAALKFRDGKAKSDVPAHLISRVEGLSDKAFFEEAYKAKVWIDGEDGKRVAVDTGLLTAEGFHATPPKAHTLSIDMKGLGKVPKEVGDKMLLIFSRFISHFGGSSFDAARLSGDEFAAKHDDPQVLERFAEQIKTQLGGQGIWFVDPATGEKKFQAVDFRHGIGRDYAEADRDLNARRRAEESGRADASAGRPQDSVPGVGQGGRDDAGGLRKADALGRGARPQAWPDRKPVAQLEGQQVTFRKPSLDEFAEGKAVIDRMKPENRALATAWFEYTQGLREERPTNIPDAMKKQLARFGIVDPLGYEFDAYGRDLTKPLLGKRDPNAKGTGSSNRLYESAQKAELRRMREQSQGREGNRNLYSEGRKPGDGPRGVISLQVAENGTPRSFNVTLLNADRSTLAHETSHFLSWSLHDIATSDLATGAIRTDYAKLLEWAGYESADQRMAEAHERHILDAAHANQELSADGEKRRKALHAKEERISHGWEQYLAEGKAPSKELASTFARFKGWMIRIYRGIGGIQDQFREQYGEELHLSDEVRGIFDRLVGAEDALNEAREQVQAKPFEDLIVGMEPADREAYLKALNEARTAADAETNQRAAEIFNEDVGHERERIRAEVAAELDTRHEYRAMRFLQEGEVVADDGTMVDAPDYLRDDKGRPLKLNRKAFEERYGKDRAAEMPAGIWAKTKRGGVDVDAIAGNLGFSSGDELVMTFLKTEDRTQAINRLTQERVDEIYAPAMRKIAEEAMGAVHNDAQLHATVLEIREMAKQVNPAAAERVRSLDPAVVRRTAAQLIGETAIADLDPARYQRAEREAAIKRAELWATGKKEEALEQAEARLLNQVLYQLARDAKERLARARTKLESTSDGIRGKLGLAGPHFRNAHEDILAAVGLVPGRLPDASGEGFETLVRRTEDDVQMLDFDIPLIRQLLSRPRPWDRLTVEQARAVTDAITNIRHVARQALELTIAGKKQTKDDFFAELAHHFMQRKPVSSGPYSETARGPGDKLAHLSRGADAYLTTVESLASMMDAHNREGPAQRVFVEGRLEGREKAADLERQVLRPIMEKWEKLPPEIRKLRDQVVDVGELLPLPLGAEAFGLTEKYTRDQLWLLFLNWGNDGNKQRIRDGNGWTDANVEKALSLLTEPELTFLQGVLDQVNSLWPEIRKVHEGRTGLELQQVAARPIVINGKEYAGGYFPLRADPRISKLGEKQEGEAALKALGSNYQPAATPRSHTKERAEKAAYPVHLQWGVVPAHLAQVIHDIAYGDWIRQVNGIILDERFKSMVTQYFGPERAAEFMPWLHDVANARADSASAISAGFERELGSFARNRVATAALAANFGNIAQNVLDPLNAIQDGVGAHRILWAYVKVMNPKNWGDMPEFALSKELAYREAALKDNMRKQLGLIDPRAQTQLQRALNETYFGAYEILDHFTTRVGFKAAFDAAIAEGLGDQEAAKKADDTVRRMWASHDVGDKSRILRSKKMLGALVMFYSFANKNYNALRLRVDRLGLVLRDEEATATDKVGQVAGLAGALMALGVVGAGAKYIKGSGPKNDESRKKWLALAVLLEPLNTVPFIGPMIESAVTGQKVSAKSAPELAMLQDTLNYAGDLASKAKDGTVSDSDKALAAILTLTALAGGPVGQVKKTGSYINNLSKGTAKPKGATDVVSGLLYGPRETANPLKDAGAAAAR